MTQETISLIIKLVCGGISLATTILAILAGIKGGKWKTLFKSVSAVNDKTKLLMQYMTEAETHNAYTGEDKLQYVLSKYAMYCVNNNIKYIEEDVTNEVNDLVKLTKEINSNGTKANTGTKTGTGTTNICE